MTALARRLPRTSAARWRRIRTFDWSLFAAVAAATGFGLLMIYSATQYNDAARIWDDLVVKQAAFAVLGLGVMALLAVTDYRAVLALGFWIYVLTVGALAAVLLMGEVTLGSVRWFSTGFADLQPGEFAKVAVIIFLAAYFERFDVRSFRHLLGSLVLVGFAAFLVLSQPNLSTAVLLGAIWLGVAFAAGIRWLHLGIIALAGVPAALLVLRSGFIQTYMVTRVAAWLDPMADPLHYGFQNIQTLIAVANGGLLGTGYGEGPLARGGWLVVLHTDNIFAVVAEELGFVGGAAVIVLLAFIVLRVLRAAGLAQDAGGRLIVAGVATYILVQATVNVAVVLQLLPVTGVSLPFLSYGGSSLLALYVGIGLVQSVLLRRKPLEFAK